MSPYFWVVGWLLDDFRCHPEGRSHKGVALAGRVGQLAGNAEIRQFHVALLAQQHVGRCGRKTGGVTMMMMMATNISQTAKAVLFLEEIILIILSHL